MKLTNKQIENWRTVLISSLGPYALIMSADQIEKIATNMQKHIDKKTDENFISKYLSKEIDYEPTRKVKIKENSENQTTFGDLIKEAKKSKKHISSNF